MRGWIAKSWRPTVIRSLLLGVVRVDRHRCRVGTVVGVAGRGGFAGRRDPQRHPRSGGDHRVGAAPVAPHPAPERLVDRRTAGVEREGVQKLVLDGGEPHHTAGDGHPARRAVDSKSLCSQRELTYDCMIQTEMPAGNAGRFSRDCFEDVKPAMLRTK